MRGEVPGSLCDTLDPGLLKCRVLQAGPNGLSDWWQSLIWTIFGQLDLVKIRPIGFGQNSVSLIWWNFGQLVFGQTVRCWNDLEKLSGTNQMVHEMLLGDKMLLCYAAIKAKHQCLELHFLVTWIWLKLVRQSSWLALPHYLWDHLVSEQLSFGRL